MSIDSKVDREELPPGLEDFLTRHKQVKAVFKGNNPESGETTYYLIAPGQYDFDLEEDLARIEIDLEFRQSEEEYRLAHLPISIEGAGEQGWTGKEIWRREEYFQQQ